MRQSLLTTVVIGALFAVLPSFAAVEPDNAGGGAHGASARIAEADASAHGGELPQGSPRNPEPSEPNTVRDFFCN